MSGRKFSLTLALGALFLAVLALGGLWFAMASKIRPETIQQTVIRAIEEKLEGTMSFEGFRFSYFPFPRAEFKEIQFEWKDSKKISAKAEKAKIVFRLLPVFFGKTDISKIEIKGGELSFLMTGDGVLPRLDITNLELEVHSAGSKTTRLIEFKGDFADLPKAISGQAHCTLESFAARDWSQMETNGFIKIHDFDLSKIGTVMSSFSWKPRAGLAGVEIRFRKAKNDPTWFLENDFSLKGFVYQAESGASLVNSPEINLSMTSQIEWNLSEEEISLKSALLNSPMGKIEASGRFLKRTGELQEVRIKGTDLLLEAIPQYGVFLKEAIPFNLGFSGQTGLEASLEGTLDHLSVHANVDLAKALLTYGRFFSKAKDIPMNLGLDYLIKDGKVLSGDFSLRFLEARVKGAIANFNLDTGDGSLTMLTNKFPLAGWQAVIPPFADYQIGGEMKILANMTGNYRQWSSIQPVFNITLEGGRFSRAMGEGISDFGFSLDYGPVAFEIRDAKFKMNGSIVEGGVMIYNPVSNPSATAELKAPHLDIHKFLLEFQDLFGENFSTGFKNNFEQLKKFLDFLFPEGQPIEKFSTQLKYEHKDKKISLEIMHFEAYQGEVNLRGMTAWDTGVPVWLLETEFDNISLSHFLTRQEKEAKYLEGNFFLKAAFKGKGFQPENWQKEISGEGSFSLTNGEFQSLDLLSGPASLDPMKALNSHTTGKTAFDDLRGEFSLKEGKIYTEKTMLVSKDLLAEAHGELYLDGLSNYRLDIFLSPALTDEVVAPIIGKAQVEEDQWFGPLPFLLSGPLSRPELKPDPALIPQILDQLAKRRPQKIFRHFLDEDLFFDRRKSS